MIKNWIKKCVIWFKTSEKSELWLHLACHNGINSRDEDGNACEGLLKRKFADELKEKSKSWGIFQYHPDAEDRGNFFLLLKKSVKGK